MIPDSPKWISKRALLTLHGECLARFGGGAGVRDEGLLDSALARPQNAFLYRAETAVPNLAAAYGFGIAKNHPFVDGNKRAAFLAIGVFLRIHGYRLTASQAEATRAIVAVASGEMDDKALAAWVSGNSARA